MEAELISLRDRVNILERELSIKEDMVSKLDAPTSALITDIEKYKREYKTL
jgi:hypothetical protein